MPRGREPKDDRDTVRDIQLCVLLSRYERDHLERLSGGKLADYLRSSVGLRNAPDWETYNPQTWIGAAYDLGRFGPMAQSRGAFLVISTSESDARLTVVDTESGFYTVAEALAALRRLVGVYRPSRILCSDPGFERLTQTLLGEG